mmetsp:Transcript_18685/g.43568  ORF Transcript_18685/g.43568 Transcript_18685/m.43568 type:complete len:864 (+) Transcript_18685:4588-7179(+)
MGRLVACVRVHAGTLAAEAASKALGAICAEPAACSSLLGAASIRSLALALGSRALPLAGAQSAARALASLLPLGSAELCAARSSEGDPSRESTLDVAVEAAALAALGTTSDMRTQAAGARMLRTLSPLSPAATARCVQGGAHVQLGRLLGSETASLGVRVAAAGGLRALAEGYADESVAASVATVVLPLLAALLSDDGEADNECLPTMRRRRVGGDEGEEVSDENNGGGAKADSESEDEETENGANTTKTVTTGASGLQRTHPAAAASTAATALVGSGGSGGGGERQRDDDAEPAVASDEARGKEARLRQRLTAEAGVILGCLSAWPQVAAEAAEKEGVLSALVLRISLSSRRLAADSAADSAITSTVDCPSDTTADYSAELGVAEALSFATAVLAMQPKSRAKLVAANAVSTLGSLLAAECSEEAGRNLGSAAGDSLCSATLRVRAAASGGMGVGSADASAAGGLTGKYLFELAALTLGRLAAEPAAHAELRDSDTLPQLAALASSSTRSAKGAKRALSTICAGDASGADAVVNALTEHVLLFRAELAGYESVDKLEAQAMRKRAKKQSSLFALFAKSVSSPPSERHDVIFQCCDGVRIGGTSMLLSASSHQLRFLFETNSEARGVAGASNIFCVLESSDAGGKLQVSVDSKFSSGATLELLRQLHAMGELALPEDNGTILLELLGLCAELRPESSDLAGDREVVPSLGTVGAGLGEEGDDEEEDPEDLLATLLKRVEAALCAALGVDNCLEVLLGVKNPRRFRNLVEQAEWVVRANLQAVTVLPRWTEMEETRPREVMAIFKTVALSKFDALAQAGSLQPTERASKRARESLGTGGSAAELGGRGGGAEGGAGGANRRRSM